MKCLKIDYSYYYYPKEYNSIKTFIDYVNGGSPKFIRLLQLTEDNCIYPYFIEEDTQEVFLNIRMVANIMEDDITILPRKEYERRLQECMDNVCKDCIYLEEDKNSQEIWARMCLDGTCVCKEKKDPDDE